MPKIVLSEKDRAVLLEIYDKDKSGTFDEHEIAEIVKAYNHKAITDPRVLEIMKKYDSNGDGHIDAVEAKDLHHSLNFNETAARYAGYTAGFARAFRYLAFTSDFGEALRPVVSARIVSGSYAIAFGYCIADVGWEAYKLKERGYVTEKGQPMSMTQCIVERSAFQAVASVALPFLLIHSAVDVTKKICARMKRFQKWGPSVVGLAVIPLLPMYLDHPVEHALEVGFEKYGPWAKKEASDHAKKD